MVKQLLLPLAAVAAFIAVVGFLVTNSSNIKLPGILPSAAPQASSSETNYKNITVGENSLRVEIADTQDKRTLGLGGRTQLDENSGMLFVFDQKNVTPTFWMKDMLIPIDIIWIGSGKVVKIDKDIPAPAEGTTDSKLTLYPAPQPIDYVLEVYGGYSDRHHLEVGSGVDLSGI